MSPSELGKYLSTLSREDMTRLLADLALAVPDTFAAARERVAK